MGLWKEDVFEKGLCIRGQQLGFGYLDQEIKPIRRHVSSYGRDQRDGCSIPFRGVVRSGAF